MMAKAVWFPEKNYIESTRLFKWMNELGFNDYEKFYSATVDQVDWFWEKAEKALDIEWYEDYSKTLDLSKGMNWPEWYVGGKLNVVHNALDKWALNDLTKNNRALTWESDDGSIKTYTFFELQQAVNKVANGFKKQGLHKGDIVTIYMPMIPETVITILAVSKIGAIYSPCFSGYGADAVATRINAAKSKMLVTADGFMRRGKEINMKEEADRAVGMSPTIEKVIVVNRLNSAIPWDSEKDVKWENVYNQEPLETTEEMQSHDPLMLIYTSGTTGRPKGAVHTHAGFPIKSAFDAGFGMDVKQDDTLFWYTDMGWMMGPFLIYGGLLNGASIVMFEGTPDFPKPDRIWEVVSKHNVTHLGISPTLIRSLMKHGEEWAAKHDMSSLRVVGSTGEPWNPDPWMWLFEKVGKGKVPIFNYSGGTEISGGILGNVLVKPIGPITFNSPIPGMDVKVYNIDGNSVSDEVGELVITKPWVGMTRGFWEEPARYEETYWSRWKDTWVHGDWVIKDSDGFWTITGRSDDILNIAGKRLGPAEIESILVDHSAVVEAGTIGVPDDVKGEAAVCFAVLTEGTQPSDDLKNELISLIAQKMGKALKPKDIHFIADLPKTRNAKVMRRAIKSAYLNKDSGDLSSLENPQAVDVIRELGQKQSV